MSEDSNDDEPDPKFKEKFAAGFEDEDDFTLSVPKIEGVDFIRKEDGTKE